MLFFFNILLANNIPQSLYKPSNSFKLCKSHDSTPYDTNSNLIDLDYLYHNENIDKLKSFFYEDNFLNREEKGYLSKKKIITMCINPDWAPIEFINEDNEASGISIDTIKLLEKKLEVKLELIETSSWRESQKFLENKKCDILPTAIITQKREKFANFTVPYLTYNMVIVTRNDAPYIFNSIDTILKENRLVTRKIGSGLIDNLKLQYPKINIIETKSHLDSFKMVSLGKAYATFASLPVISYYISRYGFSNLKISGSLGVEYQLCIASRKDEPLLNSILNKTLNSITMYEKNEIFNKWSSVKFEQEFNYSKLWKVLISIVFVFLVLTFSILLFIKRNKELENIKQELTRKNSELNDLNRSLSSKIEEALNEGIEKERMIFQQNRFIGMGEMIANIAHQWRQPLANINSLVLNIDLHYSDNTLTQKKLDKLLDEIEITVKFMSDTLENFRNFFKPDKPKEEFAIIEVLQQAKSLMQSSLNYHNIKCQIKSEEDIRIYGYKNEFAQVLIIILTNARDIILKRKIKNPLIKIDLLNENSQIVLKISDNAGGINSENISKIFDPYFTTKHQSKGTGLGLYIAKSIIEKNMNAKLEVKNENGGAVFSIVF